MGGRWSHWVILAWCHLVAGSGFLRADAGTLRISQKQNGYQVSVFTSPTPLRAGPVHVSVLVQDAATAEHVAQAHVTVRARRQGATSEVVTGAATAAAATNKLFRAAVFDLPEPGWWDIDVRIDGLGEPVRVQFEMEAAERLPSWRALWPWLAWPAGVVVLFAIHQRLVRRKTGRTPQALDSSAQSRAASAVGLQ